MRGLRKPLSHTNRTFRGTELFVSPFSPFLPYGQKYIPSHTPPPASVQTLGPAFGLSRMLHLLCRQTSKPSQTQEVTVLKYSNTLRIRQKPRFAVKRLLWLMSDSQSRPLRSDPGVRSRYVRERLQYSCNMWPWRQRRCKQRKTNQEVQSATKTKGQGNPKRRAGEDKNRNTKHSP